MSTNDLRVFGKDLRVGDLIRPWGGRTATISALRPYTGNLKHLWSDGARIADFAPGSEFGTKGMTIDPWASFEVVSRAPEVTSERYSPHPLDHLDER